MAPSLKRQRFESSGPQKEKGRTNGKKGSRDRGVRAQTCKRRETRCPVGDKSNRGEFAKKVLGGRAVAARGGERDNFYLVRCGPPTAAFGRGGRGCVANDEKKNRLRQGRGGKKDELVNGVTGAGRSQEPAIEKRSRRRNGNLY